MAIKEADLSFVLGKSYESSRRELTCESNQPITLYVKRNPAKGVVIVEWEYDGHSQWSFHHDCAEKTAADIARELAEQVKGVTSYNELSIRIFRYTTPV